MTSLDFCFDFLSPYAWFAWHEVPALRARGIEVRLRPVVLGAVLSHWGQLGPAEIAPKRRYTFAQCARYAADRGIAFEGPAVHPFNPLTALRMSLPEVAGDRQWDVVGALFRAGWAGGIDFHDDAALVAALDAIDLDGAAMLARTRDRQVKDALRAQTAWAIERDVFGVPTFLVGDELFWGVDSLPWLERYLDGTDPLDRERLARALARPGIQRPR